MAEPGQSDSLRPLDDLDPLEPAERRGGEVEIRAAGLPLGAHHFNLGIAPYEGGFIGIFRYEGLGQSGSHNSFLGTMYLDAELTPIGDMATLSLSTGSLTALFPQDPRLVAHQGRYFVVFSAATSEDEYGQRRVHLAELELSRQPPQVAPTTSLGRIRRLRPVAGDKGDAFPMNHWEKNWSPFSWGRALYFIYRTSPHLILRLNDDDLERADDEVALSVLEVESPPALLWHWGEPRGGTPAVYDRELDRFVTFFHSVVVAEPGTQDENLRWLTGFYTFTPHPPFTADRFVPVPLMPAAFRREAQSDLKRRVLFPSGLAIGDRDYLVSYGRRDNAMGVLHFRRDVLHKKLVPVR